MEKLFSPEGVWVCPKCGSLAAAIRCPQCRFSIYAGFVPRLVSSLVDGLILWPFAYLFLFLRCPSLGAYFSVTILGFIFYRTYHIGFVALWGQTPGKMLARIRVAKLDGSPVDWGNALLRNSVETILATVVYGLEIKAALGVTGAQYMAADFFERGKVVQALVPSAALYIAWASRAFVASEFVVLWMNRKKRAIHDFIAGTVVLHDPRLPLFPRRKAGKSA